MSNPNAKGRPRLQGKADARRLSVTVDKDSAAAFRALARRLGLSKSALFRKMWDTYSLIGAICLLLAISGCSKADAQEHPQCGAISFGTIGTGSMCLMPNSDVCYILGASLSCVSGR
jgi:hypothetical protein